MKKPTRRISVNTHEGAPIIRCYGTSAEIREIADWMADNGMKVPGPNQSSYSTPYGRDYCFYYLPTDEQVVLFMLRWIG